MHDVPKYAFGEVSLHCSFTNDVKCVAPAVLFPAQNAQQQRQQLM